ncbi:hypothetical protein [Streptomyces sp. NRRL S-340]|uniref:hypothetical protein n=1 Tax=Streptomyces sp. NRRL S-340 TaxID=1463901 RepID=UPI0005602D31|nr:hypothetical protein [Streptomyces sp. NRRL S-340]
MGRTWGRQDVVLLARCAVEAVAPEELWLLETTAAVYFRRPRRGRRNRRTDDMLGFGLGESVSALTMTALGTTQAVVTFLAAQTVQAAREESSGVLGEWIKRLFDKLRPGQRGQAAEGEAGDGTAGGAAAGGGDGTAGADATGGGAAGRLPTDEVALDQAVLREICDVAYREAKRLGVQHTQAELMAAAIVGRLAMGRQVQE